MSTSARSAASSVANYLVPYVRAVAQHGAAFPALLWASPQTQAARFGAICRVADPRGRSVADVGCGRADFLDYLLAHDMAPADYVGIEAVPELAAAAEAKRHPRATILHGDFVEQPGSMFVGADLVVISGALNTLTEEQFFMTIRRAFDAAGETLAFNFLCAPGTAAANFLRWYPIDDVLAFARTLSPLVDVATNYLFGDATIVVTKPRSATLT
jgi:hypothetical protein